LLVKNQQHHQNQPLVVVKKLQILVVKKLQTLEMMIHQMETINHLMMNHSMLVLRLMKIQTQKNSLNN
jgi:hypothetical protein